MWVRWLGHAIGLLASAFFLTFVIGEGLPEFIADGIPAELFPLLPSLLVAVAGSVAALFEPRVGGILQIAGGAAMGGYHLVHGGAGDLDMALAFGVPYIAAGLIALLWASGRAAKATR